MCCNFRYTFNVSNTYIGGILLVESGIHIAEDGFKTTSTLSLVHLYVQNIDNIKVLFLSAKQYVLQQCL